MIAAGKRFDVAVVGAGIVGLAHAYEAARRGLSVIVLERDALAAGASVRNFGLVLVTGQAAGETLALARDSRETWVDLADKAGFWHRLTGTMFVARHADELALLEEFASGAQRTGHDCSLLSARDVLSRAPISPDGVLGALHGHLDCRVFAREAIPALACWLAEVHGVVMRFQTAALGVALPQIHTSDGIVETERLIVCPGNDFCTLYSQLHTASGLRRCKLQMLRLAPPGPDFGLDPALLTGLSLLRYPAFADYPSLAAVRARLEREHRDAIDRGIHLIVCQAPDGDLIVGDSHDYALAVSPFDCAHTDQLLLTEAQMLLGHPHLEVRERWHGVYPSAPFGWRVATPEAGVRVVTIGEGNGMSISFGLARRVVDDLVERQPRITKE